MVELNLKILSNDIRKFLLKINYVIMALIAL